MGADVQIGGFQMGRMGEDHLQIDAMDGDHRGRTVDALCSHKSDAVDGVEVVRTW